MHHRPLGLALAAALLLVPASPALAAPVTVNLRVEGSAGTVYEGPVRTDGKQLQTPSSGGPHPCNVGENTAPPSATRSATPTTALADAGISWDASWDADFNDFLISSIGSDVNGTAFWGLFVNSRFAEVGGCQVGVGNGDQVLWAWDGFGKTPLALSGPATATVGTPVGVTVRDGGTGGAIPGAAVGGTTTDGNGNAAVTFTTPGVQRLKAERAGSIRSNALAVCVHVANDGGCGTTVVPDRTRPLAQISSPRNGRTYRRSRFVPRAIRGTVAESGSGIAAVRLKLTRRQGKRCWAFSGRRERFYRQRCRRGFYFKVGEAARFDYLLPEKLPRGRYVLDVLAIDEADNRDTNRRRGRNRAVFTVR